MGDIYGAIMGMFQNIGDAFLGNIIPNLANVLQVSAILNFVGITLILTFVVKKVQEADFFQWKTIIQLVTFVAYLGFFNWAVENPKTYMNYFSIILEAPADEITTQIANGMTTVHNSVSSTDYDSSIQALINKNLAIGGEIYDKLPRMKLFDFIVLHLLAILIVVLYILFNIIFTAAVILVIASTAILIAIWKTIGMLLPILMFFPQTRGMVGKYIITVVGLTLYKPMLMLVIFFNYQIGDYVVSKILPAQEMTQEWISANTLIFIGGVICAIIGTFISTYLVKQVPSFISQLTGAAGGAGSGIAGFASNAMTRLGGVGAGVAAGYVGGIAKSAYQGAGGGTGGVAAAGLGILTGGVGGIAAKGVASAGSALSKLGEKTGSAALSKAGSAAQTAGSVLSGNKLNDMINKTGAGSGVNNALSSGISTGTNVVKQLGNKMQGKS